MKIKLLITTIALLFISCENPYDSFMEGCLIDESFRNYCNCAYNKIELYGFEYYINNIELIAEDCSYHLY